MNSATQHPRGDGLLAEAPRTAIGGTSAPHGFRCLLDDQPDHLVPRWFLRAGESGTVEGLSLNRESWFTREGALPEPIAQEAGSLAGFSLPAEMVWLRDPANRTLLPFWLGPQFFRKLAETESQLAVASLTPNQRKVSLNAGVLVKESELSSRRSAWERSLAHSAEIFQRQGFVAMAGLIHPYHISALRRYYRCLIRTARLRLGDSQSSRRYVAHKESVAQYFHRQLTPTVATVVGEAVKPSYVYLASYQQGAELEKHTDREQCEFSVTFCLDYSPEPRRETPWPLYLETEKSQVTVFQMIGDSLLYRGQTLTHFRRPLPQGNTSTSLFLHYVKQGFSGDLE